MARPDHLTCDYLVLGGGIEELAFIDALLLANKTCTVIVADDRSEPGGHWCDAPPFAKLDHPSSMYGAGSHSLETPFAVRRDEVLMYCHTVMQRLLATKRVTYFPMAVFDGSRLSSILDSDWVVPVTVRRKTVRSRLAAKPLGARGAPFAVEPGASVIPPNDLPRVAGAHAMYVVIGAGRWGMEAVTWLLQRGVAPEKVHWVVPRDQWLVSRESLEAPGLLKTLRAFREAFATCGSLEEFEACLEAAGCRCRVDVARRPEVFRGVCLSKQELAVLRRVLPNVIRMGRVREVRSDSLILERGSVPTGAGTLYIDCAGQWYTDAPTVPIFESDQLTLQLVRGVVDQGPLKSCMSAALIGHVEALYSRSAATQNAMCVPLRPPCTVADALRSELAAFTSSEMKKDPRVSCFRYAWKPQGPLASSADNEWKAFYKELSSKAAEERIVANLERLLVSDCVGHGSPRKDAEAAATPSTRPPSPAGSCAGRSER